MNTELYFKPPRERLPGVPEGALIKAEKGVFGLRVAPRLWFTKAKSILETHGFKQLGSLPGVFVLRINGVLKGMLLLHVDDGLHIGEGPEYERAIEGLHNEFGIAAEKCHSTSFDFLGRTLEQQPDHSIRVSQRNYLDEVKSLYIPKPRRAEGDAKISAGEKTDLMSLVGRVAWIARESMPQISYEVSNLQQRFNDATVADLVNANFVLRKAKTLVKGNFITFKAIDFKNVAFVSVCDASFAGQPRSGSQQGWAILMTTTDILDGTAKANMVEWGLERSTGSSSQRWQQRLQR